VSFRDFAMAPKGDGAPTYVDCHSSTSSTRPAQNAAAAERVDIANVKKLARG
jgi:hypothetical protein